MTRGRTKETKQMDVFQQPNVPHSTAKCSYHQYTPVPYFRNSFDDLLQSDPSPAHLVMRKGAQQHGRERIDAFPTRDFACLPCTITVQGLRVDSPYPYFPIRKKTTGFCHSKQTPLLPERIPFRSSGVSFSRMMSYFSTFPRRSPV